jgi:hypothetical protein
VIRETERQTKALGAPQRVVLIKRRSKRCEGCLKKYGGEVPTSEAIRSFARQQPPIQCKYTL